MKIIHVRKNNEMAIIGSTKCKTNEKNGNENTSCKVK